MSYYSAKILAGDFDEIVQFIIDALKDEGFGEEKARKARRQLRNN